MDRAGHDVGRSVDAGHLAVELRAVGDRHTDVDVAAGLLVDDRVVDDERRAVGRRASCTELRHDRAETGLQIGRDATEVRVRANGRDGLARDLLDGDVVLHDGLPPVDESFEEPQHAFVLGAVRLSEPVVPVPRRRVHPRRFEQAELAVQTQRLHRQPGHPREPADRNEMVHWFLLGAPTVESPPGDESSRCHGTGRQMFVATDARRLEHDVDLPGTRDERHHWRHEGPLIERYVQASPGQTRWPPRRTPPPQRARAGAVQASTGACAGSGQDRLVRPTALVRSAPSRV